MTIIQPNKNNKKINFLIFGLTMTAVLIAVWGVFLYNQLINLRHELISRENNLQKIEVANAELKNNLYGLVNPEVLTVSAANKDLILEKNPTYIKSEQLARQ
jgi:cell division protein FtsL